MPGSTPAETSAQTTAVKKPLWRRLLRGVGWTLLTLIVIVALLVAFIHTSWGKEVVRGRVEKALQKRVTGKLNIASVDYGFMFSDVELEGVTIADATGAPAIELGRLAVDLDRGSLISGAPILESVEVSAVRVRIIKNADGTSNLTGLMVPQPRKGRRITINALRVSDVGVRIEKPDGSVTEVSDASIVGSAQINSVDRRYAAELSEIGAAVTIARADGTIIILPKARTGLKATVTATTADVSIIGFTTEATLTRPGKGSQPVALSLGATSIKREDEHVRLELGATRLGPLTVGVVTADGKIVDRRLEGTQLVALEGLRIAHAELSALMGREVLASDVAVDLRAEGPPTKLAIEGLIATDGGSLVIGGAVDGSDLKNPGYSLTVVGTELDTAKILASPEGAERPSLESSLRLAVSGRGVPRRPGSTARIELTTGPSRLSARGKSGNLETLRVVASADGAAIELEELTLEALGLEIAASGSLGAGRSVRAKVSVDGNPRAALAQLRALGISPSRPIPIPLPGSIDLDVTATGHLDGSIAVDIAPTSIPLAGGSVRLGARAELSNKDGKRTLTKADADVVLTRLSIGKLARIAGRKTTLAGRLSGAVSIRQRGTSRDINYDVRASLAEPGVTVHLRGDLGAREVRVKGDVVARELGETVATIEGKVPLSQRGGKRALDPRGALELDVDIAERSLAELKTLVPAAIATRLDARAREGTIAASIALRGTPASPRGTVTVRGSAELTRLPGKTLALSMDGVVTPTRSGGISFEPNATVSVAGIDGTLATIGGRVTAGKLFRRGKLDRLGVRSSARLGLTITVPERALASLAPLRPNLASLPGTVAFAIKTSGTPRAPELAVTGDWSGYATASGEDGAVHLEAAGTPAALTASIALGARKQVTLSAVVDRKPERVIIGWRADADTTRMAELLPAEAAEENVDFGNVEWKMSGEVALARRAGAMKLENIDVNGFLDLSGATLAVPGSARRYRDLGLRVEGDGGVVRLAHLSAAESDEQHQDRSIAISAEASIKTGRPEKVTASIKSNHWLVFGGSMGPTDAPRATLSADIDIAADLAGDVPVIDATVNSLDFSEPDRSLRDHGLVAFADGGDIVFAGESNIEVGKLGPRREPTVASEPRKRTPMVVKLHIPQPIHLEKTPLDVMASGDLEVVVKEDGVFPDGKLTIHRGLVALFGHPHEYESGEIVFDADNPKGKLSLTFARELAPATLRQISKASGGRAVKITIAGNVSEREISLSGAGNAGMLEVMSAHNAGRAYYYTEPDLPATSSVQAPQLLQPMVLTYLATNLPHMLVLDRFSAWSDPYDSLDSYGRVEHFVGERNNAAQSARVRIVSRPPSLGRSATEVQVDRYLINRAQVAFGAGVRAGSRIGGGLALFFEWTSSD